MSHTELIVTTQGHVGTITLNRPNRGNSITAIMKQGLTDAINQLESDKNIRVIVLTGSGNYFCTGMDLSQSNQHAIAEQVSSGNAGSSAIELFERLKSCKKPIISKINGPALGGGWGLIFTSDIRIAKKSAYFWFAEVKRGIVPALISAVIVPQIGSFQAMQFMLTGQKVSAQRAYELGFISAVANDDEDLNKIAQKYIDELLENGPEAMGNIKDTVYYVASHSHAENVGFVKNMFDKTVHSKEALYGMQCFVQKQKPNWTEFHSKL